MPELPEVETAVLSLRKKVLNKTFVSFWEEEKKENLKKIIGKKIEKVERVGKGIYFFLNDGSILHIHLKMTGHLLLSNWKKEKGEWQSKEKIMQERKNGFLRYIFLLSDGKQLALSDQRKFATVAVLTGEEFNKKREKMGPDALEIKKKDFFNILKKKREIKPLLMDQHVVSGIGNIYASEILFEAGVIPKRKADSLKDEEVEKIYYFIKKTLKKALKLKGDSTSDYRLLNGEKGGYQNYHLVYNRKDLPCFSCKNKIKRDIVGGRGTYFCLKCQK